MGKKRPVIIDDSLPQEEPKKEINKKINPNLELLERKKQEAKLEDTKVSKDSEESRLQLDLEKETEGPKKESKETRDTKKKTTKQEKKAKKTRGKKYQEAREKVERNKLYSIVDATNLAKETSYTKFEGTLEIHINTNQKGVRGLVNLPFASGKKLRIIAFGKDAQESGADIVGDDDKLKDIEKGKINFDVLVTTAEWMPKLARAAKVLGPKGLMPNPKNGTISNNLSKTIAELQGGKTEYKTESKANVVHLGIGNLSQPTEELSANVKVLLSTIGKTRINKATLSPTMGPGIKIDLSSI